MITCGPVETPRRKTVSVAATSLETPKSSTLTRGAPSPVPTATEKVAWFQIAVHDPGNVRFGDGLARLQNVVDRLGDGQPASLVQHLL